MVPTAALLLALAVRFVVVYCRNRALRDRTTPCVACGHASHHHTSVPFDFLFGANWKLMAPQRCAFVRFETKDVPRPAPPYVCHTCKSGCHSGRSHSCQGQALSYQTQVPYEYTVTEQQCVGSRTRYETRTREVPTGETRSVTKTRTVSFACSPFHASSSGSLRKFGPALDLTLACDVQNQVPKTEKVQVRLTRMVQRSRPVHKTRSVPYTAYRSSWYDDSSTNHLISCYFVCMRVSCVRVCCK